MMPHEDKYSNWNTQSRKLRSYSAPASSYSRLAPSSKKTSSPKSVSSSLCTGCYTTTGKPIINPEAYAATGAPVVNKYGGVVRNASNYAQAVQNNSMRSAARNVKKANPNAKAFSYITQLPDGKQYVGYTTNPEKRINQHLLGTGAKVTQELPPQAVTFRPHRSVNAAKQAETRTYYRQKDKHGGSNVRGAGYTARFSINANKKA